MWPIQHQWLFFVFRDEVIHIISLYLRKAKDAHLRLVLHFKNLTQVHILFVNFIWEVPELLYFVISLKYVNNELASPWTKNRLKVEGIQEYKCVCFSL